MTDTLVKIILFECHVHGWIQRGRTLREGGVLRLSFNLLSFGKCHVLPRYVPYWDLLHGSTYVPRARRVYMADRPERNPSSCFPIADI